MSKQLQLFKNLFLIMTLTFILSCSKDSPPTANTKAITNDTNKIKNNSTESKVDDEICKIEKVLSEEEDIDKTSSIVKYITHVVRDEIVDLIISRPEKYSLEYSDLEKYYSSISKIYNYLQLPVFTKQGDHSSSELYSIKNSDSKFGHYNHDFLERFLSFIIPNKNDSEFMEKSQDAYNIIKHKVNTWLYRKYLFDVTSPELLEAYRRRFKGRFSIEKYDYNLYYFADTKSYPDDSWPRLSQSFWHRRYFDGSDKIILKGLEEIMDIYDVGNKEILYQQALLEMKEINQKYSALLKQANTQNQLTEKQKKEILMDFYLHNNGKYWYRNRGWGTETPVCNWYGIECNKKEQVIGIYLFYNSRIESIPDSLRQLGELTEIDVREAFEINNKRITEVYNIKEIFAAIENSEIKIKQIKKQQRLIDVKTKEVKLQQQNTLRTLYISTNGDQWAQNSNWNSDIDPCEWSGIFCNENSEIIKIYLSYNSLSGNLPEDTFSKLTQLKELKLNNNNLSGPIPRDIGKLQNLLELNLSNNLLTDKIPEEIGTAIALTELKLNENILSENIPQTIGQLKNLRVLILNDNQLELNIPEEIGNLSKLLVLDLRNNQFSGKIPTRIGELIQLEILFLNNNQLSEEIPASIGTLASLKLLYLYNNNLSDHIPPEVGNLINLEELKLNKNKLLGQIPSSIVNLKNLKILDLSENILNGKIPKDIGKMTSLEEIFLGKNRLQEGIPKTIGNLKNLKQLNLYNNKLTGPIPSGIGGMDKLTYLRIHHNNLSESIPESIGNLKLLESFKISKNEFTGNLPETIGNLSRLSRLDISDNQFSGPLPDQISNLHKLKSLVINKNDFTGKFPADIGQIPTLAYLDISENFFSGSLPDSIISPTQIQSVYIENYNQVKVDQSDTEEEREISTIDYIFQMLKDLF